MKRSIRLLAAFFLVFIARGDLSARRRETDDFRRPAAGERVSAQSRDRDGLEVAGIELSTIFLCAIGGVLVMSLSLLARESRCRPAR